jgi:hypothetical protein
VTRIKTILGLLAVMAAMLVVFTAPALADDIDQDFEQEAESGDVDQDFDVSSTGDNSNQTVGIQGVANTGNAQNQLGLIDAGNGFDDDGFFVVDDDDFFFDDDFDDDFFFFDDDFDDDGDFEFDDVGSFIEVSPTNTTSSDQQVNQAASTKG